VTDQVMGQVMGQMVWHVIGKRRGGQKMKKLPRIVTLSFDMFWKIVLLTSCDLELLAG